MCMCFWYIPEIIFVTFSGFEASHFSGSNSIDSGYSVDASPPTVEDGSYVKLCMCFCHGLKICMCI